MYEHVRTLGFDEQHYYNGSDLGAQFTPEKTGFRLWAPTADEAKVVCYEDAETEEGIEYDMAKTEYGTWTAILEGDREGFFYTYNVKIEDEWREAVDPYAKAVSVNGDRGAVIDLKKTDPDGWEGHPRPFFSNPEDAIIYEVHIRDLSIHPDSGIHHKGKFLGAAETGTAGPKGIKTGLDHIKSLGVTHVQLLPIFDFRTIDETKLDEPQFNWGYDPKNYNVPEGSYSTDPYNPYTRIKELKQMIQTFHENGLRVIMDVVYNHVYDVDESNFHALVPGYYFRYNEDGTLANGSGVGNDIASERKMARKFIVDSVLYWVNEYKIDGFRFDLMGIHDIETMNEVRQALNKIDPTILVLGEGWDLNTPLPAEIKATQKNAAKMDGIAHFDDRIRDGLKGSVFNGHDNGFVSGKPGLEDQVKQGIAGGMDYDDQIATYEDPGQVVSYVEVHDNLTLWDKLKASNPDAGIAELKKMHRLASAIILTSQGISFIHAGQEFMRTKNGDHNSYCSPDEVNRLDWDRCAAFKEDVHYVRGLIALRKQHPAFRMRSKDQIREHLHFLDSPPQTVAFTLSEHANGDPARCILVAHNANRIGMELELPVNGIWRIAVNGQRAGYEEIAKVEGKQAVIPAIGSLVLILERAIES